MDTSASSAGGKKKRNTGRGKAKLAEPALPPGTRHSTMAEGESTLSPIFTPQGPPSLKRQRSSTASSLPHIDEQYLKHGPPSAYFLNLFHKVNQEKEIGAGAAGKDTVVLIEMLYLIHKDYRSAIDSLIEDIEALTEEIATLKSATPRPTTPTPIPFDTTGRKAPEIATSKPSAQPPKNPAPATQSWATVARRGNKKRNNRLSGSAPPVPRHNNKDGPTLKKGITARERHLIIKREGGPLATTALDLRNDINHALAGTYLQTVSISGNTVTLNTMENVKATTINGKIGTFLHLIPGTVSVHLDAPTTQLLVHGIPTGETLDTIATELTTFNTGLALTRQPRWLTSDDARIGKSASSIVVTITGPKAPEFVGKRLAAFSTTFRTERRLRFTSSTQCSNCQKFGHHNNKCKALSYCRWCASQHLTGNHICPTATCRLRGRPCTHTILRCVNCDGPHESNSPSCPSHPRKTAEEQLEGREEEMAFT